MNTGQVSGARPQLLHLDTLVEEIRRLRDGQPSVDARRLNTGPVPALRGHAVALASIITSTGLRWLLRNILGPAIPFTLFYPAIMVSAWYGGLGPGLFATGLSLVAAALMFVPPYGTFRLITVPEAIELGLFAIAGMMISVLSGALHRAWRRADAAQKHLAHSVEREQASRIQAETAREEAEAANRAKDEFLATVSHELRTPLTSILTWGHLLRSGTLNPDTVARACESIERSARSQAQLIEDMLDVSRIITGKLRLDVRQIDPLPVIEAAIDTIRPAAEAKQIRIQSTLDPKVGLVLGDPERLQQVVWNLLSNAIKFTPREGRVQVGLQRVNSHVEITVADTGKGIAQGFLPFVFDRFTQADSSSTRTTGGLGLGLAIVRHLVELHGGTVGVTSPGEGLGTSFTVKIPMVTVATQRFCNEAAHRMRTDSGATATVPPISGLKLLLVDDEPETLATLSLLLERRGALIKAAGSAREALAILKHWWPDVLVTDIGMPQEDGYTLIGNVKALERDRGTHIPAIALTAYARAEDRLKILSSGFQVHVPKPVDPIELITVIANVFRTC